MQVAGFAIRVKQAAFDAASSRKVLRRSNCHLLRFPFKGIMGEVFCFTEVCMTNPQLELQGCFEEKDADARLSWERGWRKAREHDYDESEG